MDIKTFLELREAGYTVDQIKEYAALDQPAPDPQPEPQPDPQPEPAKDPQPEPAKSDPDRDILQQILAAVRGQNINNSDLPEPHERTAQDILAEIVNPKSNKR